VVCGSDLLLVLCEIIDGFVALQRCDDKFIILQLNSSTITLLQPPEDVGYVLLLSVCLSARLLKSYERILTKRIQEFFQRRYIADCIESVLFARRQR